MTPEDAQKEREKAREDRQANARAACPALAALVWELRDAGQSLHQSAAKLRHRP